MNRCVCVCVCMYVSVGVYDCVLLSRWVCACIYVGVSVYVNERLYMCAVSWVCVLDLPLCTPLFIPWP